MDLLWINMLGFILVRKGFIAGKMDVDTEIEGRVVDGL